MAGKPLLEKCSILQSHRVPMDITLIDVVSIDNDTDTGGIKVRHLPFLQWQSFMLGFCLVFGRY